MMVGWTGLPGASKTTSLAKAAIKILYRNKKYNERNYSEHLATGEPYTPRIVWSNIRFHPDVESEFDGQIEYWSDVEQLTPLRDVDILIDEAMVYFDSRSWEHLSLDVRRWLAQHRKFGIEIYFTAQEFAQVDIAFRRLVSDLFYLTKLVGSRDISATLPPVTFIWGIVLVQSVDPVAYDEKKSKFASNDFPSFSLITKHDTDVFDTRQEIKGSKFPPLRHIMRNCELENCAFHKTIHV